MIKEEVNNCRRAESHCSRPEAVEDSSNNQLGKVLGIC